MDRRLILLLTALGTGCEAPIRDAAGTPAPPAVRREHPLANAAAAAPSAAPPAAGAAAPARGTVPTPEGTRQPGEPELPRAYVDVTMPAVTGRTIRVNAGDDLQVALDAARPGDEVVVQAGASFTGRFILRNKGAGSGWITVRTSGTLPAPGTRVTPAHAAQMPKLYNRYPNQPVIRTEPGAHHYRLIGLEVTVVPSAKRAGALVALGAAASQQTTVESIPHHIVLDRMYVHGHDSLSFQRCISMQSGTTAVVDSWIAECHGRGMDSQAIVGWNGPGPYKIVNNRLEGAGENVMFGGARPGIRDMVPSDIEFRRNHVIKPPEWKGRWTVKNLFELKMGKRVLVEGNVFENNWANAQVGFAIVLKSAAEQPTSPWVETRDVTFRYNIVRNVAHGANLAGDPTFNPVVPATRMYFAHNVFERVGSDGDYEGGRLFQISSVEYVTLTHNAGLAAAPLVLSGQRPSTNLTLTNNILGTSRNGQLIKSAQGKGAGVKALDFHAPGWVVRDNVLIGANAGTHPPRNGFPRTPAEAGVAASTPRARGAAAGADRPTATAARAGGAGPDMDALARHVRGVIVADVQP